MYLSRVEIDTNNRQKLRDLNHLGAYHNWVEKSFPNEFESQERIRKLWRIDRLGGKTYLLLLSQDKPDLIRLEKYGIKDSGETKDYSSFLSKLKNGQRAKFRVVLNPTYSIADRSRKRGREVPHITVDQQLKFLKDRSIKNGFELKDNEFYIKNRSFESLKQVKGKNLSISKVEYEGILTIVDLEKFKQTLTKGFGKKKAYGFGFMTIIPVDKYD